MSSQTLMTIWLFEKMADNLKHYKVVLKLCNKANKNGDNCSKR